MEIAVITPSLPSRSNMLADCIASVDTQTFPAAAHLIGMDTRREGPAKVRARLLTAVDTEWVAFLDDDDVLDPWHLETLANAPEADVVIPYCRFDGAPLPKQFCNRPFDPDALKRHGIFPITVLARTEAVKAAGGFRSDERYEDWELWKRMTANGCTFEVVPVVTWTYRTSAPNRRTHAA